MRTVAITNRKGGSGKTTVAVNLAAALGELGHKVLVVDFDPQASASQWLGVEDGGTELREALADKVRLSGLARDTGVEGVEIVPSSEWMVDLELEPIARTALRDCLKQDRRAGWDFVLIDCPPSLGSLSVMALVAAKEVLVPVETSSLALAGIPPLLRAVKTVAGKLNKGLRVDHFLPCRVDTRKVLHRDVIEDLREHFGERVFRSSIRETVRIQEAPSHREPITTYAPRSSVAEDFRAVAKELLKRERNRK